TSRSERAATRGRLSSRAESVSLQLVVERPLAGAEPLRGATAIAGALTQCALDRPALDFFHCASGNLRRGRRHADVQVIAAHDVALSENRGTLERVAKL